MQQQWMQVSAPMIEAKTVLSEVQMEVLAGAPR
jgi:hypothetical protein